VALRTPKDIKGNSKHLDVAGMDMNLVIYSYLIDLGEEAAT
jgi:hypothetical protein